MAPTSGVESSELRLGWGQTPTCGGMGCSVCANHHGSALQPAYGRFSPVVGRWGVSGPDWKRSTRFRSESLDAAAGRSCGAASWATRGPAQTLQEERRGRGIGCHRADREDISLASLQSGGVPPGSHGRSPHCARAGVACIFACCGSEKQAAADIGGRSRTHMNFDENTIRCSSYLKVRI